MTRPTAIVLFCLAAWVVFATARLEMLNARAGYRLPMDAEQWSSRANGGSGAWRVAAMNESFWRWRYLRDPLTGEPEDRPLTPDETARLHQYKAEAKADIDLRRFAGSAGCFQYPALFVVGVLTVAGLTNPQTAKRLKPALTAVLLLSIACLLLTLYRGPVRAMID